MLRTDPNPPKQILVRLPQALAQALDKKVPPRQRNRYFVELVQRDLEQRREADAKMLTEAAEYLNRLEAENPELARETDEWVNADLTSESDAEDELDRNFDAGKFEREFAEAQATRWASRRR